MDKQEFLDALEKKLEPVFNCTSCGKPFTEHDGIIRTCAKLQEVQAELDAIKKHMREQYKGWASAFAPHPVPGVNQTFRKQED